MVVIFHDLGNIAACSQSQCHHGLKMGTQWSVREGFIGLNVVTLLIYEPGHKIV